VSLTLKFTGRARFLPMAEQADYTLIVAVECILSDLPPMHAMLDTAAQWSLIPGPVAVAMGYNTEPDPDTPRYQAYQAIDGHASPGSGAMATVRSSALSGPSAPRAFDSQAGDAT
jgi:hypothetical protein